MVGNLPFFSPCYTSDLLYTGCPDNVYELLVSPSEIQRNGGTAVTVTGANLGSSGWSIGSTPCLWTDLMSSDGDVSVVCISPPILSGASRVFVSCDSRTVGLQPLSVKGLCVRM